MAECGGGREELRVEKVVGNLLRAGVILAASVVLMGGILYLYRHGGTMPHYRVFQGEPSDLRSVSGILSGLLSLSGRGTIQFGLLLLILTPVARVLFSIFAFARQSDMTYVVITSTVLALLIFSLAGATL